MLPLMLMLVADPLTPPPPPPAPASSVRIIDAEGTMLVVTQSLAAQQRCRNGEFQQADTNRVPAADTRSPLNDLMFRQGDPVGMTLLLERRIGGCSVPISYDVAPGGRLPSFPARAQ